METEPKKTEPPEATDLPWRWAEWQTKGLVRFPDGVIREVPVCVAVQLYFGRDGRGAIGLGRVGCYEHSTQPKKEDEKKEDLFEFRCGKKGAGRDFLNQLITAYYTYRPARFREADVLPREERAGSAR